MSVKSQVATKILIVFEEIIFNNNIKKLFMIIINKCNQMPNHPNQAHNAQYPKRLCVLFVLSQQTQQWSLRGTLGAS